MAKKKMTPSRKEIKKRALATLRMPNEHKVANVFLIILEWIVNLIILATAAYCIYAAATYRGDINNEVFILECIEASTATLAGLTLVFYSIFGHKRSYVFIVPPFIFVTLLSITSSAVTNVTGYNYLFSLVGAIVAVLVFAAAQRLFNKRRTFSYLMLAFIVAAVASSLATYLEYKHPVIGADEFVMAAIYAIIWVKPIAILGLSLGYRSRIHYRNVVAKRADADRLADEILNS